MIQQVQASCAYNVALVHNPKNLSLLKMRQGERESRIRDVKTLEAETLRQQIQIQTMTRKIETLEIAVDKLCVNKLKSGYAQDVK